MKWKTGPTNGEFNSALEKNRSLKTLEEVVGEKTLARLRSENLTKQS